MKSTRSIEGVVKTACMVVWRPSDAVGRMQNKANTELACIVGLLLRSSERNWHLRIKVGRCHTCVVRGMAPADEAEIP
jgi:hypothetical protein